MNRKIDRKEEGKKTVCLNRNRNIDRGRDRERVQAKIIEYK